MSGQYVWTTTQLAIPSLKNIPSVSCPPSHHSSSLLGTWSSPHFVGVLGEPTKHSGRKRTLSLTSSCSVRSGRGLWRRNPEYGRGRIWSQATRGFADPAPSTALTARLPHTHRWATLRFLTHCLSSWETSSSEEFSLPSDQRSLDPSGLL